MWHFVSQYLLLHSDQLELEDFGKFSAKTVEAKIDNQAKVIHPPKRIFSFIQVSAKTSEQFIDFLSKKLNITKEQAQEYIKNHIEETKEKLAKGEKIELPLIGYLHKTEENIIKLAQTATYSLEPDNFGFTEVPLPEIELAEQPSQAKAKAKAKTQKQTKKTAAAKQTKAKITKAKPAKTKQTKQIDFALWAKRIAAFTAIAALVVLAILFYKPVINLAKNSLNGLKKSNKTTRVDATTTEQKPVITQQTPQETTQVNNLATADTTLAETTSTTSTTVASATQEQPQTQQQTLQQQQQILSQIKIKAHIYLGSQYKHYYLIVGSFSNINNAKKFRQQLINEGYTNAGILTNDPTKHRVYLNAFDDLQQAFDAYKEYITRYPKRGIWLLINEPGNGN